MSYDTLYFAVFFCGVFFLTKILPRKGWVLLAASIVFYSVAGVRDSLLAAFLILTNFAFQFLILRDWRWLWPALAINLGCLAYFKYSAFLADAIGVHLFANQIALPLGISFYVFQLSAFLIDLSRKQAQPFNSLARFALFKLFFAQLVAGPIMRWRQFGFQVHRLFGRKQPAFRLVSLGLGLCVLGLTKKVILADSLAPIVEIVFRDGPADAAAAWLGLWLFSFQIYFDFSGYCDIGLGLAYLLGIRLAVNFRTPYLARTPQEFWQRWHITLSQWIRDYLYIPLGGREGGAVRQAMVLLFVMALAGLWHGANFTFVAWGLGWASAILVWRNFGNSLAKLHLLEWFLTVFVAVVLWTFFRAKDLPSAISYLGALFGVGSAGYARVPNDGYEGMLTLLGCLSLMALHWLEAKLYTLRTVMILKRYEGVFLRAALVGVSIWILMLTKTHVSPFIYFRF